MQDAATVLSVIRKRGEQGLPLKHLYRQLYNPQWYFRAYARLYSNDGAMTPDDTGETVDGMSREKISTMIDLIRWERWRWTPVKRVYIPKRNGATRFLQTVISRGTRSGVFLFGKTLTTNLLMLGAIPNQSDERLTTHPSCSDWSSIRKAG